MGFWNRLNFGSIFYNDANTLTIRRKLPQAALLNHPPVASQPFPREAE